MGYSDEDAQNRAIITVLGSDRSGIVAAVTGVLSEHDANILDISQTILQGIFTMTMLVDLKDTDVSFKALQAELQDLSQKLVVQITLQREEVFRFMYRLLSKEAACHRKTSSPTLRRVPEARHLLPRYPFPSHRLFPARSIGTARFLIRPRPRL